MTRNRVLAIVVTLVLVAGVVALVIWRRGQSAEAGASDPDPTALVTVAAARSQSVGDLVTLYGLVQADPTATVSIAAPRAVIVSRVLVQPGQSVAAGQALVEVAGAPAADLAFKQAADAVTFAQSELARVQRLYDERLAASDQLAAANKALADAQSTYAAAQKQGGTGLQTLTAPRAGVVTALTAATGDHVAQDAPLMTLSGAGGANASLALEPSDRRVAAGQAIRLTTVGGGLAVSSRVTLVSKAADPATKTLNAIAPLNGAPWAIGAAVQGEVVVGGHPGVVAPRAAVVFDETGPHVFTIDKGVAHRVFVDVGLDQGEDIEVTKGLAAGTSVAVEGAYELQDGMAVKVRSQ